MGVQNAANTVNFWRFISALGIPLELVTVDAYLSELVPKGARGMMFGFLQVMGAIAAKPSRHVKSTGCRA